MPSIYINTYADYNKGKEGMELELKYVLDFEDEIEKFLQEREAGEWFVQDYDDFPNLGENPSISDLNTILEAFNHLGDDWDAYLAYTSYSRNTPDFRDFEYSYVGFFSTLSDFGYRLSDLNIPENLEPYIDWEKFGRDLLLSEYYESDGYYFRSH